MKYRIQVTVSGDRLGTIIEAAFKGAEWDPELKVEPIPPSAERAYAVTRKVVDANLYGEPKPVAKTRRQPQTRALPGVPNRQLLVEAALKTGPKRWGELKVALSAGGLSESSLNSLISKWQKVGKISRSADGLWSLKDGEAQAAHAG